MAKKHWATKSATRASCGQRLTDKSSRVITIEDILQG